jgi:hypothetical protein
MNKIKFIIVFFLFSFTTFAQQKQLNNTEVNTLQTQDNFGAFGAVKIHPIHPNVLFVATFGKIIKSTDGGINWKTIYTKTGLWVTEFAMPSHNPDIILAATNEGLLRSINGGFDWLPLFSETQEVVDNKIDNKIDPKNYGPNLSPDKEMDFSNLVEKTPKKATPPVNKNLVQNAANMPQKVEISDFKEVSTNMTEIPKVTISPNPLSSNDIAKIESNVPGELKFRLLNSNGQALKVVKFVKSGEIDLDGVPNGTYFYRVENKTFKMGGVLLVQ